VFAPFVVGQFPFPVSLFAVFPYKKRLVRCPANGCLRIVLKIFVDRAASSFSLFEPQIVFGVVASRHWSSRCPRAPMGIPIVSNDVAHFFLFPLFCCCGSRISPTPRFSFRIVLGLKVFPPDASPLFPLVPTSESCSTFSYHT